MSEKKGGQFFRPIPRKWYDFWILILLISATWMLCAASKNQWWQSEAVKLGHAEWQVSVDGKTKFKWKEANP